MENTEFANELPTTSSKLKKYPKLSSDINPPWLLNGKYFRIIKERRTTEHQKYAGGVVAACVNCPSDRKPVHGSMKVTSNFIHHLRSHHPDLFNEYLKEKELHGRIRRKSAPLRSVKKTSKCLKNARWEEMHSLENSADAVDHYGNTCLYDSEKSQTTCDTCVENSKKPNIVKVETLTTEYSPNSTENAEISVNTSNYSEKLLSHYFCKINTSNMGVNTYNSANLPIILNGKYFKMEPAAHTDHTSICVTCQFCGGDRITVIHGSTKDTSNFVQHLRSLHPHEYEEYLNDLVEIKTENFDRETTKSLENEYMEISSDNESLLEESYIGDNSIQTPQASADKVLTLHTDLEGLHATDVHSSSQQRAHMQRRSNELHWENVESRTLSSKRTQFVEKLFDFIAHNNLPFNIVNDSLFNELFKGTNVQMCSVRALEMHLKFKHDHYIEDIKALMHNVEYVCTTEDLWLCEGKYYLGYTCHWIDSNLKRQSRVLAFKMFYDSPTAAELENLITKTNMRYNLEENKIICKLLDNGKDFIRTYHEFTAKSFSTSCKTELPLSGSIPFDRFEMSSRCLTASTVKHRKFDGQSLHLLVLEDYNNALKDNNILHRALNRSIHVLSKFNSFGVFNDEGVLLVPYDDVRWMSLYTSLTNFLMHKDKLSDLCIHHNVEPLHEMEIAHIEEFCLLLKSLVEALQFLEKNDFHFGLLFPTLITIRVKLKILLKSGKLKHLQDAVTVILAGLLERFRNYFELSSECNEAVVAAIACPSIKLRFADALKDTAPQVSGSYLETLFVECAAELYKNNENVATTKETVSEDTFLCFNQNEAEVEEEVEDSATYDIRIELCRYLNDKSRNLSCLHRYPIVKKVFEKYNTRIACTTPIEKLFHTFLDIYRGPIWRHLPCKQLEELVLIKANGFI